MSTTVSARAQRAQRRTAQSAPQPRRSPIHVQSAAGPNREILSEHSSDDRYSEYEPTDATEDSVAFTATATSHIRPEARMTPLAALLGCLGRADRRAPQHRLPRHRAKRCAATSGGAAAAVQIGRAHV